MFGYYTDKELESIGFGSIGKNVMISRAAEFANVSNIFIGNNSRIDTFAIIAPSGEAIFKIGNYVQICSYTILNGLASITVEDFATLGLHCSVLSSADNTSGCCLINATIDKDYLGTFSASVIIERHAFVATGSTVLPGVTIAEGSVVGAHSLIKESTKAFSIVAGIPAKFIKARSTHLLEIGKTFLNQKNKSGT